MRRNIKGLGLLFFVGLFLFLQVSFVEAASDSMTVRLMVRDRTQTHHVTKDKLNDIRAEIKRHLKESYPKLKIVIGKKKRSGATLKVLVYNFTAGNRAARFWVGAGSAQLQIQTQWLEGNPRTLQQSKDFHKAGYRSLRSGGAIESQMRTLIGQYTTSFVAEVMDDDEEDYDEDDD